MGYYIVWWSLPINVQSDLSWVRKWSRFLYVILRRGMRRARGFGGPVLRSLPGDWEIWRFTVV